MGGAAKHNLGKCFLGAPVQYHGTGLILIILQIILLHLYLMMGCHQLYSNQ